VNALPYLTETLPGTGGVLRATDADFFVDEELPYAASGNGSHVFVHFEKRGMNTRFAVQAIARALNVNDRDIGVAGMKDRHAVTRQWVSVPPPIAPEAIQALAIPELTILEVIRHEQKLRTGHVRANRFVLRVRDAVPDAVQRATAIVHRLAEAPGAPNWYGEQRFGREGNNAERGRAMLAGERVRDKKLARLFVSALQAELFNAWLTARMADGLYRDVLAGDVLHKTTGGMFVSDDPATDTARLRAGELVLTGPMFGESMRRGPDGSPAVERELAILAAAGLAPDAFSPVRSLAEGTRRDATIQLRDAKVSAASEPDPSPGGPSTYQIEFALPGGAYATAVMREVMKTAPASVDDAPDPA
jgi:tRNA pseudouridine13 synthase